jgi:energy-coupling factor transporter ATP-binding protein EcfA2
VRADLLRDDKTLEAAVSPAMTSLAGWLSAGRHSLALLQRAAVNLAFSETRSGGVLGINGPPGTGKTTLLRDIFAGVVTDRAEAMMRFDDPEACFTHSSQRMKAGNAWLHLYHLTGSLRGFEMVVASSNNKAVENVSREIPALSSIAEEASDLRFFKSLSDEIHQRQTWGLAAAVLGNSTNRWNFKNTFWWDDDLSMNAYLAAAAGSAPQISRVNDATGQTELVNARIVAEEKPPKSRQESLERWNTARKNFSEAQDKSRQWQTWLESLRQDMLRLDGLISAEKSAQEVRDASIVRLQAAEVTIRDAQQRMTAAQAQLGNDQTRMTGHRQLRPGFFARLFATKKAREWAQINRSLSSTLQQSQRLGAEATLQFQQAEETFRRATRENGEAQFALESTHANRTAVEARLEEAQTKHGVVLPDAEFFGREHRHKHQASPWFPPPAERAREDVFKKAILLHRAFIDAAAKPLRNNLGVLMNVFSGSPLGSPEKEALLPELWATLFLVVPLVSTTFASVGRMFGRLPAKSLGWLFVDEAGQALPQAAVGAIMRSKRVIVVGDPAQIEPVVVLPDALTEAISRSFGVDPDTYSAPAGSVQTLADAASSFSTEFQTRNGTRTVGVPLLVHRRCAEPMFGVSNKIAYSGLMVHAKAGKESAIRRVLGDSRWIHVEGDGEDKWCEEEGAEVLRLLHGLAKAGVSPDLYIVTPFVIVAERLRELIRTSGALRDVVKEDDIWTWAAERVGTVHTVQGREAEAVILVLGAPKAGQTGARGWAGGRPNLLNVAVTRAKEVLYVIGNRRLWRDAGHFGDLDTYLTETLADRSLMAIKLKSQKTL